jgi:dTDP-glucose 4,6-dehydratase
VGETYNVGGRNERSNLYVVEQICNLLDAMQPSQSAERKRLISFVTDRPGHDGRYAIDASKLNRELGWSAKETGLEKTVSWYLTNRSWWQSILRRGYATNRNGIVASDGKTSA